MLVFGFILLQKLHISKTKQKIEYLIFILWCFCCCACNDLRHNIKIFKWIVKFWTKNKKSKKTDNNEKINIYWQMPFGKILFRIFIDKFEDERRKSWSWAKDITDFENLVNFLFCFYLFLYFIRFFLFWFWNFSNFLWARILNFA